MWFQPTVGKIPWRRAGHPTPEFLSGASHGQRSLVGCSPWRCRESDMTEQVTHTPAPVFLPGRVPWTEEPGGLQSLGSQRV